MARKPVREVVVLPVEPVKPRFPIKPTRRQPTKKEREERRRGKHRLDFASHL